MRAETIAIELTEDPKTNEGGDAQCAGFDIPEGAMNVTAQTTCNQGCFYLVVTWLKPTPEELREMKYAAMHAAGAHPRGLV